MAYNMNSHENRNRFNHLYAVEFGQKRVMRPELVKFVLGSSESSDLVISSPKVADKHCEIVCSGGSWILHNLSPDGTSLVGRTIARDDTVKLGPDTILKIGGTYIQCRTKIETAHPPLRILNISVLMGEKNCYLAAESESQPDEPIETDAPECMDNSNTEIPTGSSIQEQTNGEINDIIDNMTSENLHLMDQLNETKEALKKALLEKSDLECIAAEMQEQLRFYQEEGAGGSMMSEIMENELQCSICNELLIDAITLDCSHTYCEHCLKQWKRTGTICPLCRNRINYECKTRIIDSLIERLICNLSDDAQKRRKELADSRKGQNH